jgi:hypothetical protein
MEVIDVPRVLLHPAFVIYQMERSRSCFSVTTKGLVHLGSNFPEDSMRGLRSNTKSPSSMFFSLTFLSLRALVSF